MICRRLVIQQTNPPLNYTHQGLLLRFLRSAPRLRFLILFLVIAGRLGSGLLTRRRLLLRCRLSLCDHLRVVTQPVIRAEVGCSGLRELLLPDLRASCQSSSLTHLHELFAN